jgi:methionyl-tRNA formyltransferase
MRIIFMGTPPFAVTALDALHSAGHEIVMVYTQPPRPAGRGKQLQPSPVAARAHALGLPVRTPASLKSPEEHAAFAALEAEVAVVAAYGLLLPRPVLAAPARGCINIHASLLPRWRGAAPIQRALLAGDELTGVTIMQMEAGLDTGPMLATATTTTAGKTSGDLFLELASMGADLLLKVLATWPSPVPQPIEGITLAPKIDKAEARLDWQQPAIMLERQVRALNPSPGAFTEIAGERLKILAAEVHPGLAIPGLVLDDALAIGTGDGFLRPTLVQRAGKPAMATPELLRGWPVPAGTRLA